MHAICDCTLRRLLNEGEMAQVNETLGEAGVKPAEGPLLAEIEEFSQRKGCAHLHRINETTGYCSCQNFVGEWSAELGETAGLHQGRRL